MQRELQLRWITRKARTGSGSTMAVKRVQNLSKRGSQNAGGAPAQIDRTYSIVRKRLDVGRHPLLKNIKAGVSVSTRRSSSNRPEDSLAGTEVIYGHLPYQ